MIDPLTRKRKISRWSNLLPFKLEKRLAGYIAMAGAAGVGLLAPASAKADIIYTPTHITLTQGTFLIDLNHDGVDDFKITDSHVKLTYGLRAGLSGHALSQAGGFLGTASGDFATALKAGVPIGSKDIFKGFALLYYFFKSQSGPYRLGRWGHVSDAFLGLRFDIAGEAHYGWAEFSVDFSGKQRDIIATLMGYAYETVPNQRILAGQTSGMPEFGAIGLPDGQTSGTPEPGTLGLLALGSLGLGLWRRKNTTNPVYTSVGRLL